MSTFLTARLLIAIGMAIGLFNSWTIFLHVGHPDYILIANAPTSVSHPWDHNFREMLGDLAATVIILLAFFGPQRFRTHETWTLVGIIMFGYYAGYWIGTPFIPELASESWTSEATHLGMTIPSVLGLILARQNFCQQTLSN